MTQTELDNFVISSKCCAHQLASDVIDYQAVGDMDWKSKYETLKALTSYIMALEDEEIQSGGGSDVFTETEICTLVERISLICADCGC